MTSQASLSLFLPLTKVTHAQYRKRFRAFYDYKDLRMRAHAQCASCMTVLLWQYRVKVAEYLSLLLLLLLLLLILPIFYGFRQQGELSLIEGVSRK